MAGGGRGLAARARALLGGGPRPVAIRDAWLAPERHAGRPIAVTGTVRVFEAGTPAAYCTLDEGEARIGLRGLPGDPAAWDGRRVRGTGLLTFTPGVGIFLDAARVDALP